MTIRSFLEKRSFAFPSPPFDGNSVWDFRSPTAIPTSSYSGKWVTPENALTVSAVYACVALKANAVAMMPVDLFDKDGDRRVPVEDDPLYQLLAVQPNREQTAAEFWRLMTVWKLLRGNAYALIEDGVRGVPRNLWPLPADMVRPLRLESGKLAYQVRLPYGGLDRAGSTPVGDWVGIDAAHMLHFKDLALGPVGMSRIGLMRHAVGLAMSSEEYGSRFFANDARPGGYISVPATLTDKQFERMKLQFNSLHQGAKNAHLMGLFEGGATWQSVQMANDDAQFLETRRFQVVDIARMFNVPLHMIQEETRDTSWGTGIENMGIGFVRYSLMPDLVEFENTTKMKLLAARPKRYMRFNVDALMRGDVASRNAALAVQRQWGVINADTWREKEDMDPIGGDAGETYIVPANFVPTGTPAPTAAPIDTLVRQMVGDIIDSHDRVNGHKEDSHAGA